MGRNHPAFEQLLFESRLTQDAWFGTGYSQYRHDAGLRLGIDRELARTRISEVALLTAMSQVPSSEPEC